MRKLFIYRNSPHLEDGFYKDLRKYRRTLKNNVVCVYLSRDEKDNKNRYIGVDNVQTEHIRPN